jgi:hypothetical protein
MGTISGTIYITVPGAGKDLTGNAFNRSKDFVTLLIHILQFFKVRMTYTNHKKIKSRELNPGE